MVIKDLASHPAAFVTVAELAEYWAVSRKQILTQVSSGALEAMRLGPHLCRIRTEAALRFERGRRVGQAVAGDRPARHRHRVGAPPLTLVAFRRPRQA
jgi:excisionase family DNA binding protein